MKYLFERGYAAIAVALLVVLGATNTLAETDSDYIRSDYDPLSCLAQKTADLCDGPVAMWQSAKLSISVASLAQALSLAGLDESVEIIEGQIYSDAADFGFDDALIKPSLALFLQASSVGADQYFGEELSSIQGLALLSLDSMYPGFSLVANSAGIETGSVTEIDSRFPSFDDFIAETSSDDASFPRISDFLPLNAEGFDPLEATVQLPNVTGSFKDVGLSPNLFVRLIPAVGIQHDFDVEGDGLPVSFAFTEKFAALMRRDDAELPGLACHFCPNPAQEPEGISPFLETSFQRTQLETDMTNGNYESFSSYSSSFEAETPAMSSADSGGMCSKDDFDTCIANSPIIQAGHQRRRDGMFTGAAGAITGFVNIPLGAIGMFYGLVQTVEGDEMIGNGTKACAEECKSPPNRGKGSDPEPEPGEGGDPEPEPEPEPEPGEGGEPEPEPGDSESTAVSAASSGSPGVGGPANPGNGPVNGPDCPGDSPATEEMPCGCGDGPEVAGPGLMSCPDSGTGPTEPRAEACFADGFAQVRCPAENTFGPAISGVGSVYVATDGNPSSVIRMNLSGAELTTAGEALNVAKAILERRMSLEGRTLDFKRILNDDGISFSVGVGNTTEIIDGGTFGGANATDLFPIE